MASSKLMASSTRCNSDHKRKHLSSCTCSGFLRSSSNAGENCICDGIWRSGCVEQNSGPDQGHRLPVARDAEGPSTRLNAEITLLDGVGAAAPTRDGETESSRVVKKTVDDVWREIVGGKERERQPKEEMMTLEDFLLKAGVVDDVEDNGGSSGGGAMVKVKEEGLSGICSYGSSGTIGTGVGVGMGLELGSGRGKRSLSLLEPLDKAAEQRQRRMIKNRESAARSRERKQAYQVELESTAVRLEEENDRLLKEKAEHMKKRLKQLMDNVIPVVEKRRPPRVLRKVQSMQW